MTNVGKNYTFGDAIYNMILQMIENETMGYSQGGRLGLGGGEGEDGGDDDPPRPFVGQLAQRRVAYDTTQAEHPGLRGELISGWRNSLLDNLNHMRYWQKPARWFEPEFDGSYTVTVGEGFYWTSSTQYLDYEGGTAVIGPPSPAGERLDVLYVTKAGAAGISAGTPVASGVPAPTYPALDHIPVAEIFIKGSGDVTITEPGIDYYYASGTAAGYIFQDVRPFFGNTDPTSGGVEYLADLLDVTDDSPVNLDVLSFDSSLAKWKPLAWSMGGIGGGQPALQVDGPIEVLTHVGGAYITTRSGEVNSVYIYCEEPGISGATIVDVNLNDITVFQPQSGRPSLDFDDLDQIQRSTTLTGAHFDPGTLITVDIDEAAIEASGLTIVMALDIPDAHPHSGGPHTGVLNEWEIRDSAISGYPLVGNGLQPLGGPSYQQVRTIGIQDDAIVYDKIGPGGLKIISRQGSNASDWNVGTYTSLSNYDLTDDNVKVQVGTYTRAVVVSAAFSVTFPSAFNDVPVLVFQPWCNTEQDIRIRVQTLTNTGFTGKLVTASDTINLMWMAIGPE